MESDDEHKMISDMFKDVNGTPEGTFSFLYLSERKKIRKKI